MRKAIVWGLMLTTAMSGSALHAAEAVTEKPHLVANIDIASVLDSTAGVMRTAQGNRLMLMAKAQGNSSTNPTIRRDAAK